jgi:hypothetical protein
MAHRIRWALTQEPIKETLDGIVEVDETYIGGKLRVGPQVTKQGERPKDRPQATANKAAVVAVLKRGGSVRSHHIERVTAANIEPIIEEMVSPTAHLMTDTSTVLSSAGSIRKHDQVNHSARERFQLIRTAC